MFPLLSQELFFANEIIGMRRFQRSIDVQNVAWHQLFRNLEGNIWLFFAINVYCCGQFWYVFDTVVFKTIENISFEVSSIVLGVSHVE